MAVQYTQLQDLNYVPSYNSLDPQLVSGVDSAIQQESMLNQKFATDTLGQLEENVRTNLSNLNEEDQAYASNVVSEARDRINTRFETQGTRGALNYIKNEASNFRNKLQPHFKFSATQQQLQEDLADSDAPTIVRSSINPGKIEYDEQGTARYSGISQVDKRRLEVARNWERIPEALTKFNSKARQANSTETSGQRSVEYTDGSVGIENFSEKLEVLDEGDLMRNNMSFLLSDPKMREQLAVLGEVALEQRPPGVTVDEQGRVTTEVAVPRKNDQGQYIDKNNNVVSDWRQADVRKENVTYNTVEAWQASQFSRSFAERDAYYNQKLSSKPVDTSTGTSRSSAEMSETPMYFTEVGVTRTKADGTEYLKGLREEVTRLDQTNKSITPQFEQSLIKYFGLSEGERLDYSFDNGQLRVKYGNKNLTEDQLEDELIEKIQSSEGKERLKYQISYDNIFNRIAALKQNEIQAAALERTISNANDSVINQLRQDPEFRAIADIVSFSDSGEITVNENAIKNSSIAEKDFGSAIPGYINISESTDDLRVGEIREVNATQTVSTGATTQRVEADPILIYKNRDGKIRRISKNSGKVGELINRARTLQDEHVNKAIGADRQEDVIGVGLSIYHKDQEAIMEDFKINRIGPEDTGGQFNTKDGTMVTNDSFSVIKGDYFQPDKVAMIDGQATVIGKVFDKDGNPKEDLMNIRFTGERANSIAQRLYGNEYENVLTVESFKSLFPKVINSEEKVTLDNNVLNRLIPGAGFKESVDIEYRNVRKSGQDQDTFVISVDGIELSADNAYDMYIQLLNYSTIANE